MVKNLISIFAIMLLVITSIAGCSSSEGYKATEYLNIQTSNPQERILTIGQFSGQKTEEWEFSEATRIGLNCKLEKGSIAIALHDPDDKLILERELPTAGGLGKGLHGQFKSGIYKLNISSRNARNVEINVVFSDHDEVDALTQAEPSFELKRQINEITKGDFQVTLHEEYPIISAYLRGSPPDLIENGPYYIIIMYGFEKGELKDDSPAIKDTEETQLSILYGPYEGGDTPIQIMYSPIFKDKKVSGANNIGSWNINDKEVEFYYIDRRGKEIINVNLNLDEGGIDITYFLSNKFAEEDARDFTAFILEEVD